jgi:NAD+ diphosphatase
VSIPSALDGFHASSILLNSKKRWIVAAVAGDLLLATGYGVEPQLVMSEEQADTLRYFREQRFCIGQWQGDDCEVWDLLPEALKCDGFLKLELRSVLMQSPDPYFSIASRAVQLLDWRKKHQFCGQCGKANQIAETEHALICDSCSIRQYPRISPCVIVAVTHGDRCLFARHPNWPENRFSTLAGFIEAGESAEQALHREVFEEVGLEIQNIRYIGSQAWPYPGQLMLGYLAEAKTENFVVDGVEIAEAHWFKYDDLPSVIAPPTIMAGRLIQQFVREAEGRIAD